MKTPTITTDAIISGNFSIIMYVEEQELLCKGTYLEITPFSKLMRIQLI